MSKSPRNPTTDKPNLTLASSTEAPAATPFKKKVFKPKVAAMPKATFSPEALAALLNEVTESRKALAEQKAALDALTAQVTGKTGKAAKPTTQKISIAGKSEKAIKNELETIKAFKKIGITNVIPKVNVFTFNLWLAKGFRPLEGSKACRVANLRLWHETQVRPLTASEKKQAATQLEAARLRREGSPSLEVQ